MLPANNFRYPRTKSISEVEIMWYGNRYTRWHSNFHDDDLPPPLEEHYVSQSSMILDDIDISPKKNITTIQ